MRRSTLAVALLILTLPACSVRKLAVDKVGDALAGSGAAWSRDDDPELVREAAPFALKTIESLLDESPNHEGLLLAAARGFTQYAYAWVQQDADRIEAEDLSRALELRSRARNLYLRALGYGLRGLELKTPDVRRRLREKPEATLSAFGKSDVPLLYWTSLAWGGAISLSKDDADLTADLSLVEKLMRRAMELDEAYELGAIHDFFIAYEGGRPAAAGGSIDRARMHLKRAVELSSENRAAPFVTFAETVSVSAQDKTEFQQLLEKALAVDIHRAPEQRLSNVIYQKRARWLLARIDELFLE